MKDFLLKGSFDKPIPSVRRIFKLLHEIEKYNFSLQEIYIYSYSRKATFVALNCAYKRRIVTIPINLGLSGVVDKENSFSGDNKTPLTGKKDFFMTGKSRVRGIRYKIAGSEEEAVYSRDGQINLGSAFVGIDAVNSKGVNRGIGFHGHKDNLLEPTNGCIRMYNDDLLLLAPIMVPGVKVFII
ncbi:MAG: L,D-transpeptidase family protein [Candidatus Paceibacterota bacterium]